MTFRSRLLADQGLTNKDLEDVGSLLFLLLFNLTRRFDTTKHSMPSAACILSRLRIDQNRAN